jgi:O-acetyl-ADP-ribose deacetylase (regulator of RNase III)
MGAGIAVRFKKDYPEMFSEYRRRCKTKPRQFNLGDAFLWKEKNKPFVFNLGTQERPGPYATYQAIETALVSMISQAENEGITSTPRIGSGYGGLEWEKVREVIENVLEKWPHNLFVYEGYQPE